MTGHTPAPWVIDNRFDDDISVEILAADTTICAVDPLTGEWTPEEIANARLICAAPDLLAAALLVRSFLRGLEDGTDADDPLREIRKLVHAPLLQALEAAIIKAESI
jgi:hypothetical protein